MLHYLYFELWMNWRRPVRALNRMACNQSPSDGPLQQTFITHYTVSGLVWGKTNRYRNCYYMHSRCKLGYYSHKMHPVVCCKYKDIVTVMIPKIVATEIRQLTYLMSSKSLLRQTLPLLAKY